MVFIINSKDRNIDLEKRLLNSNLQRHLKLAVAECEGRGIECNMKDYKKKYLDRQTNFVNLNIVNKDGYLTDDFAKMVVKYEDIDSFSYIGLLKENIGNCAVSAFLAEELYSDMTGKHMDILWLDNIKYNIDHVVLYDKNKNCMYSFAVGPFIRKNSIELPKHEIVTEEMMIQYCHMIGKKSIL